MPRDLFVGEPLPKAGPRDLFADEKPAEDNSPPGIYDYLAASPGGALVQGATYGGQEMLRGAAHLAESLPKISDLIMGDNKVAKAIHSGTANLEDWIGQQRAGYEAARRKFQNPASKYWEVGGALLPAAIGGAAVEAPAMAESMLGNILNSGVQGAKAGGITGFLSPFSTDPEARKNYWLNKAGQTGLGAATGGVMGAVVGSSAPTLEPELKGQAYVRSTLEKSGKTAEDLQRAADEADDKPITTAEAIGPQGQTNLMALGRREGETAGSLQEKMNQRAQERSDRVFDDMAQSAGIHPAAAKGDIADYVAAGQERVKPLYEAAFERGSLGPLEPKYEAQFNQVSRAYNEAKQAVSNAQAELEKAAHKTTLTDNVYAQSAARQDVTAAQANVAQANKAFAEAEANKTKVLDGLRQAQGDNARGAPGAMWSPRIQQFLDEPVLKAGLARGLKIQRLNALEKGEEFRPSDYGVVETGKGPDGEPTYSIVTSEEGRPIPTLRTLDAGKRGLDAILEDHRNPTTRILNLRDPMVKAINGVRMSYISAIDQVAPPEYQAARAIAGDYLSAESAFQSGQKAILNKNLTETDFNKMVARMTPQEVESLKGGIANKLFDMSQNGTLRPKQFLTPRVRAKLSIALGPNQAESFIKNLEREAEMRAFETRAVPSAGSQTAPLSQAMKEQETFGSSPLASDVEDAMLSGHGPRGVGVRFAKNWLTRNAQGALDRLRTRGLDTGARNEAGRILLMSPKESASLLKRAPRVPQKQPWLTDSMFNQWGD